MVWWDNELTIKVRHVKYSKEIDHKHAYRHFFSVWLDSPIWAWAFSFRRRITITHFRHTTLGRTPLDEGPARRRDLYLTTHNTHNRQTSMTPVGFEPAIPVSERPQTHALDRAATAIGLTELYYY
jgi:hypothetical protein